jgi:hypothetical protein
VRVDTPKTAKASLRRSNPLEIWKEDPPGIANENELHDTLAIHQDPDLSIDLARKLRQSSGEFVSDEFFGRDASLVELLQAFFLKCLQTDGVS